MLNVTLLPALSVMALFGVCLMYFGQWRAQRRMRSVMQVELSRIFEQIDLLRLDCLPTNAEPEQPPAVVPAPVRPVPAADPFKRASALPNGEAYAAALELAARGADHGELTARCGLGRDEARILVAMQTARARRANAA